MQKPQKFFVAENGNEYSLTFLTFASLLLKNKDQVSKALIRFYINKKRNNESLQKYRQSVYNGIFYGPGPKL